MPRSLDIRYDVASAISQGQRDYQEDAIVTDFSLGTDMGFAVLADGMGGHAAGDVASKIVVTEVFSELKLQTGDLDDLSGAIPDILRDAAMAANDCMKVHIKSKPETRGMGATLLAPVFVGTKLFWISIGDSPLYLFRDGVLKQLNEDHSMAPQIDFMIRSGMMTEDVGRNHPDRSCLTSVLGGDHVPRIDCPDRPTEVQDGDILVMASDGIQYLTEDEIADVLADYADAGSAEITSVLLKALEDHGDPEQDNASFSVIKVSAKSRGKRRKRAPRNDGAETEFRSERMVAASTPSRFRAGIIQRSSALFRGPAE